MKSMFCSYFLNCNAGKNFSVKYCYTDFVEACTVGIHDYAIPDESFNASSTRPGYFPYHGRLNRLGNSWHPARCT